MEQYTIALLVQIGLFISFLSISWLLIERNDSKFRTLKSIASIHAYMREGWKGLFPLFVLAMAATVAPMLEVSGLFFIPMLSLVGCATMIATKTKRDFAMIILGAIVPLFSLMIITTAVYGHWWVFPASVVAGVALSNPKLGVGWYVNEGIDSDAGYIKFDFPERFHWWLVISIYLICWTSLIIA